MSITSFDFDESVELKPKKKTKKKVEIIETVEVMEDNEIIDTSVEGEEIDPKREYAAFVSAFLPFGRTGKRAILCMVAST